MAGAEDSLTFLPEFLGTCPVRLETAELQMMTAQDLEESQGITPDEFTFKSKQEPPISW